MSPIYMAIFCLGLFALYGCSRSSGEQKETQEKEREEAAGVPDGIVPAGSDLKKLFDTGATTGRSPLEFDYGDRNRIVFHGYFGLFVCERQESGWQVFRSLDLKALGADATVGDDYAVIDAGRERAYITPAYFAPENENPVTYCFEYENNLLTERWKYQSVKNDLLSWSYSQAMPVQEKADRLLEKENLTRTSNIYPVRGIGGGEFGFLAAENGALESLRYCVYRDVPGEGVSGESEMGELDIFPLFRNGKGE